MRRVRPEPGFFPLAVNQQGIRAAFAQLRDNWTVTIRRAYGRNLEHMVNVIRELGILPVEVLPNSPGKNAADVALIIDAMAEMYEDRVDGFCFVSGDGDLTRLAIAARERGFPVIVFGGPVTPASLRKACTEFHLHSVRSARHTKSAKSAKQSSEHEFFCTSDGAQQPGRLRSPRERTDRGLRANHTPEHQSCRLQARPNLRAPSFRGNLPEGAPAINRRN